ncbi:zinc knuckle CX2CX4HX4C containing protein [Tanacetum coccineum]
MEKEDPADVTESLANDFNDFIAKLSSDVPVMNGPTGWDDPKVNVHGVKEVSSHQQGDEASNIGRGSREKFNDTSQVSKSSFAAVLQSAQAKRAVKIKEMHNSEVVAGARVVIPMEAVEEVRARFANTLYGYFNLKRLAFPLVENHVKNTWAKFGLKRVMLDDEFFLFQFETKEGMEKVIEGGSWLIRHVPLILGVWTPNTVQKKDEIKNASVWVKLHHVPIVAYSKVGLSLITTQIGRRIMLDSYTSKLEYEWTPQRCTSKFFDYTNEKSPKIPKVDVTVNVVSDGFIEIKKKKNKPKNVEQVEGVRLSKPKPYRRVEHGVSSKTKDNNILPEVTKTNTSAGVPNPSNPTVKNCFSLLSMEDQEDTYRELNDQLKEPSTILNESDSEEEEEMILEGPNGKRTVETALKGASTPIEDVSHV